MIKSKSNEKIIENKIALSFREFKDKKILFRLFNNKRDKTKSFIIYENAKFSNTIEKAFNSNYRKIDIEYDSLNRLKYRALHV